MKKNPWLGLLSYDEEKIGEGYKFCGRSLATQELFSLIDNNIFVTMYGKSGIGKSSLLQAGLFPTLRDNDYFPVYIRLGNSDVKVSSYSEIIVETIKAEISRAGFHIKASENLLPEKNVLPTDDDYLWRYFVSNEFCDSTGRVVFPVVVIDQFEELFFLNRQHLATLLRQVYLLIDDSSLSSGSIGGSYVTNFRFLFSIREDDFFRLEDVIEHQRLVEMKYNRYRLTELSDSEATEVVLQPAGTLFAANEEDAIVERIIGKAKGDSGEINSAILSLLCSRLYDYTVSKGGGPVTLQSLNAFLQGSGGNFLASFFDDVIARLKDRTKWEYIEDALVTDDGRRNSVQKSLFDANVPDCEFLFKGEMAILRCVTYSAGTVRHVEMIHDLLATHLKASRNERRQKAEMLKMRRRQRRNAGVIAIALLIAAFFAYQFVAISKKNDEIIEARRISLVAESRYIVSEAKKEYDKGSVDKALKMALYALPNNLRNPNRPYVVEAEAVLRQCDLSMQDEAFRIAVLPHNGFVLYASFSPNGGYVVTASGDNTARVWNAMTGEPVTELLKHNDDVISAVFSPCGKYVVTASDDSTARVWDAASGKPVTEPLRHKDFVNFATFSPDGKYVVTASSDNTARIWDVKTGKAVTKPLQHSGPVYSVAFSPDGKNVVTASRDNTARVWDVKTGKPVTEPLQHVGSVNSAVFSPNGKYIATASVDCTARIWDVKGKLFAELQHNRSVNSVGFSPDSRYIVTASQDSSSRIMDIFTGEISVLRHKGFIKHSSFSSDGMHIVTASWDNTACVWGIQTGNHVFKPLKHDKWVNYASIANNGKYIVTASHDNTACIWYMNHGNFVIDTNANRYGVNSKTYNEYSIDNSKNDSDLNTRIKSPKPISPSINKGDGQNGNSPIVKKIIVIQNNIAYVCDESMGHVFAELQHKGEINSAEFSLNGKYVVTASDDSTARVWDATTGKPLSEPLRHKDFVNSAVFSPDGRYVVTASTDATARVWDYMNREQVGTVFKHNARVNSAIFSNNGKYIITTSWDNTVRVWDIVSKNPVTEPLQHDIAVDFVQLSLDNNYLITVTGYNELHVWDLKIGKLVLERVVYQSSISSAVFSPDGKSIVMELSDGTARIWPFPSLQELIDKYRNDPAYDWSLTQEEKDEYSLE